MKTMTHTWYYKYADPKNPGKFKYNKVKMTSPSPSGTPLMMEAINKQEINTLKQREGRTNLTIITRAEYTRATAGGKNNVA